MAMPGPDPNFIKEQQQVMRMIGLKRAKKVKTTSTKKLLLIVIPVLLLALVFLLYMAGVFEEGRTFSWNGAIYRLPNEISSVRQDSKPEGFKFAGYLDPEGENDSANWHPSGEIYVKGGSDRVVYLYLNTPKGYYKAKKK